jgi:hypothetical protein
LNGIQAVIPASTFSKGENAGKLRVEYFSAHRHRRLPGMSAETGSLCPDGAKRRIASQAKSGCRHPTGQFGA